MLMPMAAKHPLRRPISVGRIVELAMVALALVFLVLLIVQFAVDLSPRGERRVNLVLTLIWAVFGIDFFVRLALAPSKIAFLRSNWIAGVALIIPAFRVLRVFSLARVGPSVRVAGIVSGGKRGTEWLHRTLGLHPALYIGLLTLFIMALSTAGMFSIEHTHRDANIRSIGDAIWWTTATLTTIGSELYPVTNEGRALAIFIMIYSVGFAGYVAGSFAAILLGVGQSGPSPPPADADALDDLRNEVRALRQQLTTAAGATTAPRVTGTIGEDVQPSAATGPHHP
jgi:voltage-gated potassium channel